MNMAYLLAMKSSNDMSTPLEETVQLNGLIYQVSLYERKSNYQVRE